MRKDAPKPDTSTAEALKRLLLDVKSTAYTDPKSRGVSGALFVSVLDELRIAEEVNKKSKSVTGVHNSELVAKGEVELAVQAPSFKQPRVSAAVSASPKEADATKALVDFLSSLSAVPAIKAKGCSRLEPPR